MSIGGARLDYEPDGKSAPGCESTIRGATRERQMETVVSRDGTKIAYDKQGEGPAVVLVAGALCARSTWSGPRLSKLLAPHFTVYNYDRRGRGDSGNTKPYAVGREIEDIEALIDEVAGTACLYGHSSGAALALEVAMKHGRKVRKLAMYEAPYNDAPEARRAWGQYITELTGALAANRRSDAVALFMRYIGIPADRIDGMRRASTWPVLEALAPTLAYDHTAMLGKDASVPAERASTVTVPTLVMSGGASYPFMRETARTLSQAIPDAQLRTLEDQTHEVNLGVLAPVLIEFFSS